MLKMSKVKITLVKSMIDRPLRQKETLKGLGLKRINQSVVRELNPPVEGMINKISHLVTVEEIK